LLPAKKLCRSQSLPSSWLEAVSQCLGGNFVCHLGSRGQHLIDLLCSASKVQLELKEFVALRPPLQFCMPLQLSQPALITIFISRIVTTKLRELG